MSEITEPNLAQVQLKNFVVGGKWHESEKPAKHAAFRLSYVMISERYAPSAVYSTLCTVFRDTGLLTDEECRAVVNVSCGFAGMPVMGVA